MEQIALSDIIVEDRQRKEYGDLDSMADSIKHVGLIQPIVLAKLENGKHRLMAGGRRYEALKLGGFTHVFHGVTCDKTRPGFVFNDENLDLDRMFEIELEENTKRKDMTWQEEVLNIYKVHTLRKNRAATEHKEWGYKQTGRLMGVEVAKVGYTINIAKQLINDPEGPVAKAATYSDGLRIMMQRKEDEINKELARRTLDQAKQNREAAVSAIPVPKLDAGDGLPQDLELVEPPKEELVVPLTQMLHLGDCLNYLKTVSDGHFNHCITDTPYAIDMDMLDQSNPHGGMNDIDRIRETHKVDENLEFLAALIPEVFRVTDDNGFFVTWCDIMTWQFLYDRGIEAGFRVQRWPVTWQKMHQCMNQMAQYNFTKSTEIAIVMRKPGATLARPATTCVVMANNDRERKKFGHPFVKPFEIWEFLAKHVAIPGQKILEPCAGVGSGVLSLLEMGFKVDACEIDETHFNKLVLNVQEFYQSKHPNCKFT